MSIVVENTLHPIMKRYLSGAVPFLEFERQFIVESWDVEQTHEPHLIELAHAVICLLIDFREGQLSKDEFDAELWDWFARDLSGNVLSRVTLSGAAASDTIDPDPAAMESVGTRHVAALS